MSNPNFPNRVSTMGMPSVGLGVQIPDAPYTGNPSAAATFGAGIVPQAGTAPDPLQMLAVALRPPAMNAISGGGEWSWDKAVDRKQLDVSAMGDYVNQNEDQERAMLEQANQIAAMVMMKFIQDVKVSATHGKTHLFREGLDMLTVNKQSGTRMEFAVKFLDFVNKTASLRLLIAQRAAMIVGFTVREAVKNGQIPDQRDIDSFFIGATENIGWLEMGNWLKKTPEGQVYLPFVEQTPFTANIYNRIHQLIENIAECFAAWEYPNPYEGFTLKYDADYTQASNASLYAMNPLSDTKSALDIAGWGNLSAPKSYDQGSLENDLFGPNGMVTTTRSDYQGVSSMHIPIKEDIRRYQSGELKPKRDMSSPWAQPHDIRNPTFTDFQPVVETPALVGSRKDWANLMPNNRDEFALDLIMREIPGTEWYLVEPQYIRHIVRAYKFEDNYAMSIYTNGSRGLYGVRLIDGESPEYLFVPLEREEKLMMLTDPTLLLPKLVKDENGDIVIEQVHHDQLVDVRENGDKYYLPLKEVREYKGKPVNVYFDDKVEDTSSEQLEKTIDALFNKHKDHSSKEIFSVSLPVRNYTSIVMESVDDAEEVYRRLDYLIKGTGGKINNYFNWLEQVYKELDRIGDNRLTQIVDQRIVQSFLRWSISARGYGDKNDRLHLPIKTMVGGVESTQAFFKNNDYETYLVLTSNTPELERLINGSKMLMNKAESFTTLTRGLTDSPIDQAKREVAKQTIVIYRDIVLTKVGNMPAPTDDVDQLTVRTRRSVTPVIFNLVQQSFGHAGQYLDEPEQFLLFEQDERSIWTFMTSDYDRRNVATLQRVNRGMEWVYLDI